MNPGEIDPKLNTFVFVTPRIWQEKKQQQQKGNKAKGKKPETQTQRDG